MIKNIFESIKKINEYNQEYWSARDLYKLLGYTEYGKFVPAIERAKKACENSKQEINLHFAYVSEPQKSRNQYGEIDGQILENYHLSRYACYFIALFKFRSIRYFAIFLKKYYNVAKCIYIDV